MLKHSVAVDLVLTRMEQEGMRLDMVSPTEVQAVARALIAYSQDPEWAPWIRELRRRRKLGLEIGLK